MRGTPMRTVRRWMRTAAVILAVGVALTAVAVGCGGEQDGENDGNDDNDSPPPHRPNSDDDSWETEVVPFEEEAGFRLRMRMNDGTVGLAFFEMSPEFGEPCEELGLEDVPDKILWSLHYAERSSGGDWHFEEIHNRPWYSAPAGLSLNYDHQGRAVVATMIGDPEPDTIFCGVNDVGVLTRQSEGDWDAETAVSESGEATTGDNVSDAGFVVGHWPALAVDSSGAIGVAYRDIHFGSIQADDFRRADLEYVHNTGGDWEAEPVNWRTGAGVHNRLVFDANDDPIIGFYMPTETSLEERVGFWIAKKEDEEWIQVQLTNQPSPEEPDLLYDQGEDTLYFAYYDAQFGAPKVATLEEMSEFESASSWEFEEIGDATYDEGYSPSMAMSPDGTPALAYRRCNIASSDLGDCDSDRSAVVFAYQDGGEWKHEIVDTGDNLAFCGNAPELQFDGDEPVIAYRCEVAEEVGGAGEDNQEAGEDNDEISIRTEIRLGRRDAIN